MHTLTEASTIALGQSYAERYVHENSLQNDADTGFVYRTSDTKHV